MAIVVKILPNLLNHVDLDYFKIKVMLVKEYIVISALLVNIRMNMVKDIVKIVLLDIIALIKIWMLP